MYEVTSQTIRQEDIEKLDNISVEENPLKEWKFKIGNGNTGSITIADPLLDTYASAEERAMSEFLRNSYSRTDVEFTTYRTDFYKNMVINVKGLPYLVKSIQTSIDAATIKTKIRAVRYE